MKREVIKSNEAIELLTGVFTAYANLKEQFVANLKRDFDEQRQKVIDHLTGVMSGLIPANRVLNVPLGFKTLDPLSIQSGRIEKVVLENLSISGRPRAALNVLTMTMRMLNNSIEQRNEWMREFKAKEGSLDYNARCRLVFGLRHEGQTDETYKNFVDSIFSQTDDCMFFSRMILTDVIDYGHEARARFRKKFRGPIPRITLVSFDAFDQKGLMPSDKGYAGWATGFYKRVPETEGRTLGKIRHGVRSCWRRALRGVRAIFDDVV
jgi:hypothetical protein